jgi:hypothetical protein
METLGKVEPEAVEPDVRPKPYEPLAEVALDKVLRVINVGRLSNARTNERTNEQTNERTNE